MHRIGRMTAGGNGVGSFFFNELLNALLCRPSD
jgi:hypothetical protein